MKTILLALLVIVVIACLIMYEWAIRALPFDRVLRGDNEEEDAHP